jgi:eukaryotic-like serine/threonine-protein kinase
MANGALDHGWTIPSPGDVLAGKYQIERTCGRGGLSVVFAAMHEELDRRVAIKVLLPEWAGDFDVVQRFLREGRAATRIRSEHVVRVFDVGTLDSGAPFLVLEFLEGHNLDEALSMWGPLPVSTAIDWMLQAAEAIGEAHAHGIVHRDLKPANLFLTQRADGTACIKVIDFGLSKLTDPRMRGSNVKLTRPTDVMGSPHYMAPEQLRATCDADLRADLWSLGAALYELLTGQPPFAGDTVPQLCATVLTESPQPPSAWRRGIPPQVDHAVLRCLEKDPENRFASAAELARALAPFGTEVARESYARIERVREAVERASRPSPLPMNALALRPTDRSSAGLSRPSGWGEMRYVPPAGASARVILGSLLILAGMGVGAFMLMYAAVHGAEPSRSSHASQATVGIAAPQGMAPAPVPQATAPVPLAPAPALVPALAAQPAPALSFSSPRGLRPTPGRAPALGRAMTRAHPIRIEPRPYPLPPRPAGPGASTDPDSDATNVQRRREDATPARAPAADDLFENRK